MCVLLNKIKPVQGYIPGGPAGSTCPVPPLPTDHVSSHLVIQRELAESRNVLGPLNEHQQLLLHGLAHICDAGDLFRPNVSVDPGDGGGDLGEEKENAEDGQALLQSLSSAQSALPPDSFQVCKRGDGLQMPSRLRRKLRGRWRAERMLKKSAMREEASPQAFTCCPIPNVSFLEPQGDSRPYRRSRAKIIILI